MKFKKLSANFFKRPLLTQVILLSALLGIVYFFEPSFDLSKNNYSGLATLNINFETMERSFEGEVSENMTILDALNMSVSVG